jgi:hypothetical protein
MKLPALKDYLGNEVEATGAVGIRLVVREGKGLADEAESAWVKPEEPGAKIPRPVRPRDALLTDKIKERAFKRVKLQREG